MSSYVPFKTFTLSVPVASSRYSGSAVFAPGAAVIANGPRKAFIAANVAANWVYSKGQNECHNNEKEYNLKIT